MGKAIAQGHPTGADVGKIFVFGQIHVTANQFDIVLVESLVFVERVVCVDVLDVGRTLVGSAVGLLAVGCRWGVAFSTIDVFVAIQNRDIVVVQSAASEVVVVVASRVIDGRIRIVLPGSEDLWGNDLTQRIHIVLIGREVGFVGRAKSVETDVLCSMRRGRIVEGINRRGACRDASPSGLLDCREITIDVQAILKRLVPVFQDIF